MTGTEGNDGDLGDRVACLAKEPTAVRSAVLGGYLAFVRGPYDRRPCSIGHPGEGAYYEGLAQPGDNRYLSG